MIVMKRFCAQVLLAALLLPVANIRCVTEANLLKAGSPLIAALGSDPELSSFTSLLQTPGLDKLLADDLKGPFTLLAPTNEAINKLGPNAMSTLINPANLNQLAGIIRDHMVAGKLDATGLLQPGLKAVSGKAIDLGTAQPSMPIVGDKFHIVPVNKILGR
jgi:uncharacterized surface protein with fasciclin (FAS1) repeats